MADPHYRAHELQTSNARHQQIVSVDYLALKYIPDNFSYTTYVGMLSVECSHCGALKFPGETELFCCSKCNVQLAPFPQPKPFLQRRIVLYCSNI